MNIFQKCYYFVVMVVGWVIGGFRKPKPSVPPQPPLPIDEQPGFIGDLLRMGEAASGDAPQTIEPPVDGTPGGLKRG